MGWRVKSRLEKERAERVEPFMKGAQVRCSSSLCSNIFPARSWFLQITDHVVPPLFLIRRSCKCWSRSIQNMSSMSTLPWTMRVPWLLQGLLTKTNCTQKRQNFQIWRRSCCSKVLFLSGWTWPLLSRTGLVIKKLPVHMFQPHSTMHCLFFWLIQHQGVSLEDGRVSDKVAKEQGCIV